MTAIFSFAIFMGGLTYLSSIQSLRHDIDTKLLNLQSEYDCAAAMLQYAAMVKTGRIAFEHTSRWVEFYDNNMYRAHVEPGVFNNLGYQISQGFTVTGFGRSSSYGWDGDINKAIQLSFATSTYADYLYLSDRERDPVRNDIIRFWTPDTLDGKVHSNDTLHISGSPRFIQQVSFHPSVMDPPYNGAHFDMEPQPNAQIIVFPDQYNAIRAHNGYPGWGTSSPDSATEITFDGAFLYKRTCGIDTAGNFTCFPSTINANPPYPIPASGALFIEGKVIVKADRSGSDVYDPFFYSHGFSGKLTLASSDTMIIPDNLIYEFAYPNNYVPEDITDVLGLISENYIMFGENCPNTLYINAAMAAINGSITVQDIYHYGYTNEKQSLFIHGSLAQRNRGLVHSTYGGGVRGFIEKDYHYDTRLRLHPPPYFLPVNNEPEVYYENFYSEYR